MTTKVRKSNPTNESFMCEYNRAKPEGLPKSTNDICYEIFYNNSYNGKYINIDKDNDLLITRNYLGSNVIDPHAIVLDNCIRFKNYKNLNIVHKFIETYLQCVDCRDHGSADKSINMMRDLSDLGFDILGNTTNLDRDNYGADINIGVVCRANTLKQPIAFEMLKCGSKIAPKILNALCSSSSDLKNMYGFNFADRSGKKYNTPEIKYMTFKRLFDGGVNVTNDYNSETLMELIVNSYHYDLIKLMFKYGLNYFTAEASRDYMHNVGTTKIDLITSFTFNLAMNFNDYYRFRAYPEMCKDISVAKTIKLLTKYFPEYDINGYTNLETLHNSRQSNEDDICVIHNFAVMWIGLMPSNIVTYETDNENKKPFCEYFDEITRYCSQEFFTIERDLALLSMFKDLNFDLPVIKYKNSSGVHDSDILFKDIIKTYILNQETFTHKSSSRKKYMRNCVTENVAMWALSDDCPFKLEGDEKDEVIKNLMSDVYIQIKGTKYEKPNNHMCKEILEKYKNIYREDND